MSAKLGQTLVAGTLVAAADLTGSQFFAVKQTSATEVNLAGAGEAIFGILMNDPNTGEAATCDTDGHSKAEAGAAVALGALVTPDANGRLITAIATDIVAGRATSVAAALGDVISIELLKGGTVV